MSIRRYAWSNNTLLNRYAFRTYHRTARQVVSPDIEETKWKPQFYQRRAYPECCKTSRAGNGGSARAAASIGSRPSHLAAPSWKPASGQSLNPSLVHSLFSVYRQICLTTSVAYRATIPLLRRGCGFNYRSRAGQCLCYLQISVSGLGVLLNVLLKYLQFLLSYYFQSSQALLTLKLDDMFRQI